MTQLVLIAVGFIAAFFVLGGLGFYEKLGLSPQEGLGWLLGPLVRSPELVVALGVLVAAAYLAGRIWDKQ